MTTRDSVRCPKCGADNRIGATFCTKCRASLISFSVRDRRSSEAPASGQGDGNGNRASQKQSPPASTVPPVQPHPVQPGPAPAQPAAEQDQSPAQPGVVHDQPTSPQRAATPRSTTQSAGTQPSAVLSLEEVHDLLDKLQSLSGEIDRYLPSRLPDLATKRQQWRSLIATAQACLKLYEDPRFQEPEMQQLLNQHNALSEAARALDFTHRYTVKMIGHAGAGKSTLLAAILGRDILPSGFGGAFTGIRTSIRLCPANEPELMRVQFQTRQAFDRLLEETKRRSEEEKAQQANAAGGRKNAEEGPFTVELKRLQEADKKYGKEYLRDTGPKVIELASDKWQEEGRKYIVEPPKEDPQPRLIRLIDSVEFNLHADSGPFSLLPEGSAWVDLPGGAAGQVRHEDILREELRDVDAVILVVGNNRPDNSGVESIFELVKNEIVKERTAEVAANMIFVAVTRWDEINSDEERKRAESSMQSLLNKLPENYVVYHQHGPNKDYFFYPLRAFDAFFATLALRGSKFEDFDQQRKNEAEEYKSHFSNRYVYQDLLKLQGQLGSDTLPQQFNAPDFASIQPAQHEAILLYSGLPQLKDDLKDFLTRNRYNVQLQHAKAQLSIALAQLEEACRKRLGLLGLSRESDPVELREEIKKLGADRELKRYELLDKRSEAMKAALEEVLLQFDAIVDSEQNPFYQVLSQAHQNAIERVKKLIDSGYFDPFVKRLGSQRASRVAAGYPLRVGSGWIDIEGSALVEELRTCLGIALEKELANAGTALHQVFYTLVNEQVNAGVLDMAQVVLGETGSEIEELKRQFGEITSQGTKKVAQSICIYVTMGELLNEQAYWLKKDNQVITSLYALENSRPPDNVNLSQAHAVMANILGSLSAGLAENTRRRIVTLFRSELQKRLESATYDPANGRLVRKQGEFTELTKKVRSVLAMRLAISPSLIHKLDDMQNQKV
ncbi:MAG TPA: dynamin family protein, partial [Ktedonobacteraceae bacterium]|nr:dynamin family protein [Ktedonobacteraceae bacterium]